MPVYQPLEEIDQSKPLDMSKVTYGFGDIASAAYENVASGIRTRRMIDLAGQPSDERYAGTMPASDEEIAELKKQIPDFNPPTGISRAVVQALADNQKNNQYFAKVSSRPSGWLAKTGAFAGGLIGGFYDPKTLIYGLSGAGAGEAVLTPIAESFLTRMAANRIIGKQVSAVGSLISENVGPSILSGVTGGTGFGLTAGIGQEADTITGRDILGQDQDYIENLMNIGNATLDGAVTGGVFGAGHYALLGRKVSIAPAAEMEIPPDEYGTTLSKHDTYAEAQAATEEHAKTAQTPHEYNIYESAEGGYRAFAKNLGGKLMVPEKFERRGGLLSRTPLKNLPDQVTDLISKYFKSWTPESDQVMRTESVGQMANGQFVNVDPIVKQGKYEQGVKFREEMAAQNIDPEELDRRVAEAQEEIVSEMFSHYFDFVHEDISDQALNDLYQKLIDDPESVESLLSTVPKDIRDVILQNKNEFINFVKKNQKPYQRIGENEDLTQHEFYHGTGLLDDVSKFDINRAAVLSLYGPGLYITDNKNVALTYAKAAQRTRGYKPSEQVIGKILELKFKENPKLIDIEKKPNEEVFKIIQDEIGTDRINDSMKYVELAEIYANIRTDIEDELIDREVMFNINAKLQDAGYDGFTHIGGIATNQKINHNVVILFGQEYSERMPDGSVKYTYKNPSEKLNQKTIDVANEFQEKVELFKKMTGGIEKEIKKLEQRKSEASRNFMGKITRAQNMKASEKQSFMSRALKEKNDTMNMLDDQIKELEGEKIKLQIDRHTDVLNQLRKEFEATDQLRDQINDTLKPVSTDEMKAYAEHLEKGLLPEQDFSIEPDKRYTTDEQLAEYSDKDIETLAESSPSSAKEIMETVDQLKKQGMFEEMAQNMTDCFLRNV
jgi:hypothetical protein